VSIVGFSENFQSLNFLDNFEIFWECWKFKDVMKTFEFM
jgi:hypothetical protein